jgi:hypothetical protein
VLRQTGDYITLASSRTTATAPAACHASSVRLRTTQHAEAQHDGGRHQRLRVEILEGFNGLGIGRPPAQAIDDAKRDGAVGLLADSRSTPAAGDGDLQQRLAVEGGVNLWRRP